MHSILILKRQMKEQDALSMRKQEELTMMKDKRCHLEADYFA